MKKKIAAWILACAILSVCAGCGKQESRETGENTVADTTDGTSDLSSEESASGAEEDGAKALEGMTYEEVESYLDTLPETSDVNCWETSTDEMPDGEIKLTHYEGNSDIVIIPEELDGRKVTKLDMYCFTNNENIVAVKFNSLISELEERQFTNCTNLQYVTGLSNIEKIGDSAFNTPSLKAIRLYDKVTEMNDYSLSVFTASVYIPKNSWLAEHIDEWCSEEWNPSTTIIEY